MQPLVSIPVITYNSAKTVTETLESIKAQTYPNIELIISDDCSTDDTVALCREWVEKNAARFVRTELITVEKNTGVSGNLNRAEAACHGVWVKPIAGDDILLPYCIQDCVNYSEKHSDAIYIFGRQAAFGADLQYCEQIDKWFDYTFFTQTAENQLHRLLFNGNCVPASTLCYHRERAQHIGVKNDERIPLLEDWPKWINLLRAGVKFHFIDKVLVKYRVGGISTGTKASLKMYRSERLFDFYYRFPEWYKENQDEAIRRMVDEECDVYKWYLTSEKQLLQIRSSKAYRLGKLLFKPFQWMKRLVKKLEKNQ